MTSRFASVADAYVSRAKEHRNYGGSPALRTSTRPRLERSYLRFAVAGLAGEVTAARLRVYAETASQPATRLARSPGNWAEATIDHATAPAPGRVVATSGPVAGDT